MLIHWRERTLLLAAAVFFAAPAIGAEIHVMISGGFSAAYAELVPQFERATGHKVSTVRGASMGTDVNALPVRLQRGEPADVLILVGDALEELAKGGHIAAGSRTDLARSEMGLAVRKGLPKPDIKTVDAFKRAMLDAKSVAISTSASGVYLANELFPQLGITGEIKGKTRVVGVTGVVVAKGEADIAIQQISELLPVAGIDYVGPLPREIQKVTMFVAVLAAGAKEVDAAKALIGYLASPAAAPAIAKSALEPVTSR